MHEKPIIQFNLKVIICKLRGYHDTYKAMCRGDFFGFDCRTCGSRFMTDQDKPRYPNFKNIMQKCKAKMLEQFPEYGNSWRGFSDFEWWKKRLNGEIKEIWKAKTKEEFEKEIVDTINVLSMMHDNSDDYITLEELSEMSQEKIGKK